MSYSYPAIYSRQRGDAGLLVAAFTAPAGELVQWADIDRLKDEGGGHQRLKKETRVRAVHRFLELDDRNIIPTALVIALQIPETSNMIPGRCSFIEIPDSEEDLPGLVIDGQHRMYGINSFDPITPVNIVALINPDNDEIAFQFLVINSKASKVPTDHVKRLAINFSDQKLEERLKTARMRLGPYYHYGRLVDVDEGSPFRRSVDWPTESTTVDPNVDNLVRPSSIEQAIAAIVKQKLPDLLDDDDSLLEFFFTLWWAVRERWPNLWSKDSKLLQKVGLVTLTTFIIEDLVPLVDRGDLILSDSESVKKEITENILEYLTPDFWQREWSSKSLDTSAGRRLVVEALTTIRRNNRRGVRWDTGVNLLGDDEDLLQG